MKVIGYRFFAFIYNFCIILFRQNKKKILLWNGHNHGLNGNLLEIRNALEAQKKQYQFVCMSKRDIFHADENKKRNIFQKIASAWCFFIILPYQMATAKKIFFNDNFLPLEFMKTTKRDTQFVQLWHGAGAFKRFGLSSEENQEVYQAVKKANNSITHLFITSKHVMPFYEEAFAIDKSRIYPTGIPVTDLYFDEERKKIRRENFYLQYPELKDKKILLYAPTFRQTSEENDHIMEEFDVKKIHEILGEEWVILIKMHPKFPVDNIMESEYCLDLTTYNDISDLYLISDLLVTDYSSTVVEYVLLDKPIILFAYDLEKYDRGFYYNYQEMMPGPIAHNQEEFLDCLKEKDSYSQRRHRYVDFQYDYVSGNSASRILDVLQ